MLASLHPICPIFTDQRSCILNAQEPPEIIRMLVPFLKLAVHLGTFQPNLVSLTIFTVSIFYSRLFFLIFCVYISASLFYYLYTKGYYALLVLNEYVYNNSRNSSDSRDIGDSEDKQNVGQQERAQSQRIWWTARTRTKSAYAVDCENSLYAIDCENSVCAVDCENSVYAVDCENS